MRLFNRLSLKLWIIWFFEPRIRRFGERIEASGIRAVIFRDGFLSPFSYPPVRLTMARIFLRSITASSSCGVPRYCRSAASSIPASDFVEGKYAYGCRSRKFRPLNVRLAAPEACSSAHTARGPEVSARADSLLGRRAGQGQSLMRRRSSPPYKAIGDDSSRRRLLVSHAIGPARAQAWQCPQARPSQYRSMPHAATEGRHVNLIWSADRESRGGPI